MAAANKDQLLTVTLKEYGKLETLLSGLSKGQATVKDADGASIKDIVGHRAHWIELFIGWYRDGQEGKEVFFPAPGYKWNQLKAYNAALRQSQAALSWNQTSSLLSENHARLLDFITSHDDADLYDGPMKGANNDWTAGRWAEAAGSSHYRSAAKYVKQALKQQRS